MGAEGRSFKIQLKCYDRSFAGKGFLATKSNNRTNRSLCQGKSDTLGFYIDVDEIDLIGLNHYLR